jgi:hypothetical protein
MLVSEIDIIDISHLDISAKEKLAKVAEDVKASGKKNIFFFSMIILNFL